MAKRPPPGRCVHCLGTFDSLTWDHGFPISWYPHGPSAEKPKAPSCEPSQRRVERSERDALLPLAMGLSPAEAACFGVPETVMRSITPELATTARERKARQRRRQQVLARIVKPESSIGALPGWRSADSGGGELALPLAKRDLDVVSEKVARIALWCMRSEQFVESSHRLSVHAIQEGEASDLVALIRRGECREIATGARITVRTAADDPRTHMMLFELWGRFRVLCSVVPVAHASAGPT